MSGFGAYVKMWTFADFLRWLTAKAMKHQRSGMGPKLFVNSNCNGPESGWNALRRHQTLNGRGWGVERSEYPFVGTLLIHRHY